MCSYFGHIFGNVLSEHSRQFTKRIWYNKTHAFGKLHKVGKLSAICSGFKGYEFGS